MTKGDLSKEEIIEKAVQLKSEEDEEVIRKVVCNFFGSKKCDLSSDASYSCKDSTCLRECKEMYLKGIFTKPQNLWSEDWDLPVEREITGKPNFRLECNKCHLSNSCYAYKSNHLCSIDWGENSVSTDPKLMIEHLIKLQHTRLQRAKSIEIADGGVMDQNLSIEMERYKDLALIKSNFDVDKFSLKIEGEAKGNGGGLLSQLFGGLSQGNKTEKAIEQGEKHTIDVPFEEEKLNPEEKPKRRRNEKKLSD